MGIAKSSTMTMGIGIGTLVVLIMGVRRGIAADCTMVTSFLSACSSFVIYGSPDPYPGSPCCQAMASLSNLAADTVNNRQSVCACIMGLITTYNPNATAIATVPGFCGISLGFTIDPNTDCH